MYVFCVVSPCNNCRPAESDIARVTIDILPEDVLLEIFDIYVDPTRKYYGLEAWCTLVHVCRKWRNIVLESPLRLNLRIRCHPATPVREKVDIWPALPIVLMQCDDDWQSKWGVDNVAVALEQNNRICQINLWSVPTSLMGEILAAMHKSFPVLTYLDLGTEDETLVTLVDPDLFLGGSAPCLRFLQLASIPFPGLPNLLFSATHLADLRLYNLSHSGYISPEAMVSCLSTLTRLETLILEFEPPESFPVREHRRPPPPTLTLLPALTRLHFRGVSEYLEDLVVRIDTPLLDNFEITLPHQFIPDTAQLAQFIGRASKLKAHDGAHVVFHDSGVRLTLPRIFEKRLEISYEVVNWQVSSVAQVSTLLSQAFSATVERLYICDDYAYWRGDIRVVNNHWLEFLRPFTSVKSLYLSRVIVQRIAPALQGLIGERVAGVLPALQTLFLEDLKLSGPVQEAIGSFVSRRQFSSHPVAVSQWNKKQVEL
jgi:F-box-like